MSVPTQSGSNTQDVPQEQNPAFRPTTTTPPRFEAPPSLHSLKPEGEIRTLSFSTINRLGDPVDIDGKRYHLIHPSRWGAAKADELRWHLKYVDDVATALMSEDPNTPRLTEQQIEDYEYHLCESVKLIIPDAPADVIEKLGEGDQQAIVQAFMLRLTEQQPQTSSMPNGPTMIGETPSAESADSIQDTPGEMS